MMSGKRIILGSGSPRRMELMQKAGFSVEVMVSNADENFDENMELADVAEMLAVRKAQDLLAHIGSDDVLVTADSVVILNGKIYNKPTNRSEAISMLTELSGQAHEVITGVCICFEHKLQSFSEKTIVSFSELTESEIQDYVDHCAPYDKAGAYGIQEWIGWAKIEKIDGSFANVMGLPVEKVYKILVDYCNVQIK
ncbi:MAG: septum formation protein Maf [Saprospiraceae bacterium]|nr:septum formation protein Maf [Saprospiraceae bacterium]